MQQPKDPIFYPNDTMRTMEVVDKDKNTLQSIDHTLKRKENMNETEAEMKERFRQLFTKLSETSNTCEASLLPSITSSMLEIYSIFRTIPF